MAIALTSCTGNKASDTESEEVVVEVVDSDTSSESVRPRYTSEELDSLALSAWGDLKFGISQKEAKKSEIFKGGSKYDDTLAGGLDYELNLCSGLGLEGSLNVWADFIGKGYSTLSVIRVDIGASKFDRILTDIVIFMSKFKEIYGEPDYMTSTDMSAYNLGNKRIRALTWHLKSPNNGTKTINCYIEGQDYDYYRFEIIITNDKFVKEPTKEELEAAKKKEEDVKNAVNNAF